MGGKKCLGCDKPAKSGLCEDCEKNLNALEKVMRVNGLKFTKAEAEG